MTAGDSPRKADGDTPAAAGEPPRPAVSYAFNFAGAVLLSALLGLQLWLNGKTDHPNVYLTYGLGFGVLFLLGVPVNKLLTFVLRLMAKAGQSDD